MFPPRKLSPYLLAAVAAGTLTAAILRGRKTQPAPAEPRGTAPPTEPATVEELGLASEGTALPSSEAQAPASQPPG